MNAGNIQIDPSKRHYKNNKSSIIERIRFDIESKKGCTIEELRKSYNDDFSFYRTCLVFTVATNKALCTAIGISPASGRKHSKQLKASGILFKVELVQCPFTGGKDWSITANPRKAFLEREKLGISPSQSPQ